MTEEPGYTQDEIERGEDRAWHIPLWSCFGVIAVLALLAWLMFYSGMFMHGD